MGGLFHQSLHHPRQPHTSESAAGTSPSVLRESCVYMTPLTPLGVVFNPDTHTIISTHSKMFVFKLSNISLIPFPGVPFDPWPMHPYPLFCPHACLLFPVAHPPQCLPRLRRKIAWTNATRVLSSPPPIKFGAGLIKMRGDPCWKDLTCMDYHYQTQPNPNPLSRYLHLVPGSPW